LGRKKATRWKQAGRKGVFTEGMSHALKQRYVLEKAREQILPWDF
jgi:hypothetical protein